MTNHFKLDMTMMYAVHDAYELALLDEMENEHAALPPLLGSVDAALGRGESATEARAELAAKLQEHFVHEEEAALPLIDATLTEEQWMGFGEASAKALGPDMPRFLPWLLEGATPERAEQVLAVLPEPVRATYRDEWRPAYVGRDWWGDVSALRSHTAEEVSHHG